MIAREKKVDIDYLHRQGLSYREIARKTGCDRRTAKRYAQNPELIGQTRRPAKRASILDSYKPMIESWLKEDGKYQATWVYDQIVKLGYTGGYTIVKDFVHSIKQVNTRIAYIRFETEPGKQAQVDFADMQVALPDGEVKTYYLFSMILGFSRKPYNELLERCDLLSFLDVHQRAFAYFGGVPAEILYDRMRNVFIRKLAGKTQFTQGLMTLADHYGFTPIVAPAYSPWIKGKVERPMDFIREGFWRGYAFTSHQAANRDLQEFTSRKDQRVHGTTGETVIARFEAEKAFLKPLARTACDVSARLYRRVHKDCTISVEGSRYEVPHTLVGKSILVRLKAGQLRIFEDSKLMATHTQAPFKGRIVQLPGLREAILADRQMNARKYDVCKKGKGKATISPAKGKYDVDVEQRSLEVYEQIGRGVAHG